MCSSDLRVIELQKTVNIKGFRPGKAPVNLLKKQFAKALYGEVLEKILQDNTYQALTDNKIKPASQPKIEIKSSMPCKVRPKGLQSNRRKKA